LLTTVLVELLRKEKCACLRAEVSAALIGIMSVDDSMGEALADAGVVKLAASLLVVK
ncbi:hypothetical protein Pmar_PMAR029576, partial [Perkinsus marinus ATCC 50983]